MLLPFVEMKKKNVFSNFEIVVSRDIQLQKRHI